MSNGRDPYNQQPYNPYAQYDEPYQDMYQRPTFPANGAQVQVDSLIFIPSGTYQDQFRRPWVSDMNQDNANQVYDAVNHAYRDFKAKQDAGTLPPDARYAIDPATLSHVSSSFILPSAAGEAPARLNLQQSLQQQTARFMMAISVMRHGAVQPTRYYLTGYTSNLGLHQMHGRAGLNNSDFAVDHQMDMTVNMIMEVREVARDYGYGPFVSNEMVNVDQVLVDTQFNSVNQADVIRMRPYEVTAALARMNDPQINRDGVTVTDTRYIQNSTPEFSDVHHANPNDYMARILGGLAQGRDEAIQRNQSPVVSQFNNAVRQVRDRSSRNDPFFKAIANYTDGIVSATFKFRDLLAVDPNAERDEICKVQWRDYGQFANKRGENMAAWDTNSPWHGSDPSTQWAAQITNLLPPMMIDLGMRRVELFATNTRGETLCEPVHPVPFMPGVNLVPQLQLLKTQFYQQYLMPMSVNNQIPFDLDIVADLYGDITIKISVFGYPAYTYVFPAFMGSAMSPVLTTQAATLDHLSSAFLDLQREVLPAHRPLVTELGAHSTTGNRY